jgi:hypothetical protein
VCQRSSGVRSRNSPQLGHCFVSISKPLTLGMISPSVAGPNATGGTFSLQMGHEYRFMLQPMPRLRTLSTRLNVYTIVRAFGRCGARLGRGVPSPRSAILTV